MIINTGMRTDIPAFYSRWLMNRIKAGYVMARSPYDSRLVFRYSLAPSIADLLAFCTKNPLPMLPLLGSLSQYKQFWFVTLTPYGREIEPGLPDKKEILKGIKELSRRYGKNCVEWRYDPVFLSEKYNEKFHIKAFGEIAAELEGYAGACVISFIDLYEKVKRNFPEAREVPMAARLRLGKFFAETAAKHNMALKPCAEGNYLAKYGADCSGCMTIRTFEKAIGEKLSVPKKSGGRPGACACHLSADIGAYDTCGHLCRYCYANSDPSKVAENMKRHDSDSPMLIGNVRPGDRILDAEQHSWRTGQHSLF